MNEHELHTWEGEGGLVVPTPHSEESHLDFLERLSDWGDSPYAMADATGFPREMGSARCQNCFEGPCLVHKPYTPGGWDRTEDTGHDGI